MAAWAFRREAAAFDQARAFVVPAWRHRSALPGTFRSRIA